MCYDPTKRECETSTNPIEKGSTHNLRSEDQIMKCTRDNMHNRKQNNKPKILIRKTKSVNSNKELDFYKVARRTKIEN